MPGFEPEETEIAKRRRQARHAPLSSRRCFLRWLWFSCLICCLWVGCARSELTAVSGVVSLDDRPLQEGTIHFAPADGKAPSQAAMIQDGKFSTQLHRTAYKVEIHATKLVDTGVKLDERGPGGGPTAVELLPPRYNIQTELTLNVTAPTHAAHFDLKSR
jgi:hypothetical protein